MKNISAIPVPDPLDEPPAAWREFTAQDVVGFAGDIHDEIMGALEFGRDPQYRQQEPQVGGNRGLQQELAPGQLLDLPVQCVNELLALSQGCRHVAAPVEERLGYGGQVLGDHAEQLDDVGLDCLQRAV